MKEEEYGPNYQAHLLEQYKLYIEMTDRISNRRDQMNKFYMSLLSGIVVIFSIVIESNIFSDFRIMGFIVFSVLGLSLCLLWNINLDSHRRLNAGKFKVIHEIEQNLPFLCYEREWEIIGKGEKDKRYFPFTKIEQYIPLILAIPYILLFAYSLFLVIEKLAF